MIPILTFSKCGDLRAIKNRPVLTHKCSRFSRGYDAQETIVTSTPTPLPALIVPEEKYPFNIQFTPSLNYYTGDANYINQSWR